METNRNKDEMLPLAKCRDQERLEESNLTNKRSNELRIFEFECWKESLTINSMKATLIHRLKATT